MTTVTLTPEELHLAWVQAAQRRTRKLLERRLHSREEKQTSSILNEIGGACGELAVCKHLGIYWTGAGGVKHPDGKGVEVRWTKHSNGGLILYRQDDPDSYYVLTDGIPDDDPPVINLVGWIRGSDATQVAKETPFGLLVPREHLRPIRQR